MRFLRDEDMGNVTKTPEELARKEGNLLWLKKREIISIRSDSETKSNLPSGESPHPSQLTLES